MQINHVTLPGPGGLRASVFLVTIKQGGTWQTVLKPGFLVMNQTPSVLYLRHCQPSAESRAYSSGDAEGSTFAVAQVKDSERILDSWQAQSNLRATFRGCIAAC